MYNILICDDEKDIVAALKIYLEAEGYDCFVAYNGREAMEKLRHEEIQLVLLDVMMPEMDGISALTALRAESNVPVILLTAKSEDSDKVLGLNLGADDYVTKPFNPVELIARVRSQLRRYLTLGGGRTGEEGISIGPVSIDERAREVTRDGERIALTPTEYEILRFLMLHAGQVFSPREIYRRVWNGEPYGAENTVSVHIRHLREKLEINPAEPRFLKAVWGQGYKFDKNERSAS